MTQLDVYIDFASPACYLALKPTLALAKRTGCRINWLAFRTQQRPALKQQPNETKTQTHLRIRDEYRRRACQLYADVQGIPIDRMNAPSSVDFALRALMDSDCCSHAFVTAAFEAYWRDGTDLNEEVNVARIAEQVGTTCVPANLAQLEEHLTSALERGIVDAPAYVVDEQVFIGREHLPWITTLTV